MRIKQIELREIRIDLARMNDELSNITKFFGDWHLARIYKNIAARLAEFEIVGERYLPQMMALVQRA